MTTPSLPQSQIVEADASVWGTPLQPVGCPVCKQVFLVEASRLGKLCPNCARGKLESQPALLRPEAPELLAPFRYSLSNLRPSLEKFVQEVWLCPDDFDTDRLLQRAVPVYWPMWLVDSDVVGEWRAEAGFDYQVKSSQESYGKSGWTTHEVVETRIRWEPRAGQITRHYDNVSAPAISEQARLLKLVGQYQLNQAAAYQPEQVKGAILRVPDLPPENAWPLAQSHLDEAASAECRQAAGAQHIRNFGLRADYQCLNWTQLLLPLYVTWYADDQGQPPHPIYLNGQSGVIGGARLASQKKGWQWAGILLAVAAVMFILALLCAGLGMLFPPITILGILLGIAAIVVACAAIIPAIWPSQWNRGQAGKM
jgi:hypothetical protein